MTDLSRHVLLKHVRPFIFSFLALTLVFLVNTLQKIWHAHVAGQHTISFILQVAVLSAPFVIAMTLPMAVLFATLYTCMRIAAAAKTTYTPPHGSTATQVIAPVVAAAAVLSLAALLWNGQLLPRTNRSLQILLASADTRGPSALPPLNERTMTIGELRDAASRARTEAERAGGDSAPGRVAAARREVERFEIEIQKKYALAASCVVLALFGAAVGCRLKRGANTAIVASCVVFGFYYVSLVGGEAMANRLIIPAFVGMWGANVILAAAGLFVWWRLTGPRADSRQVVTS